MQMKEVEKRTGLPAQSIRYYEREGLILPARNQENRYRDYSTEDVEKLETIAFCRKLGVPINDIRRLFRRETSLSQCVEGALLDARAARQHAEAQEALCEAVLQKLEQHPDLAPLDCSRALLVSEEAKNLYRQVIPPEARRQKPNWGLPFLLAVVLPIVLFAAANIAMIAATASFHGTLNQILYWMAQPDTAYTLTYGDSTATARSGAMDPAVLRLERTLMQPDPVGFPMWQAPQDPVTVTLDGPLGKATLILWQRDNGIAVRWTSPTRRTSGLLTGAGCHVDFCDLTAAIVHTIE